MKLMLTVRDMLSRFYGKYDTFIRLFLKAAAAFIMFVSIRETFDQPSLANRLPILFVLAAGCMFLPSNAVLIASAGLIMVHFYGISLEAAIVGGGILMIAMLLYFSMAPRSAWPLLLTALALGANIGCVPAIIFGLIGGPLSAVGSVFGAFAWFLLRIVKQSGGNLQATSAEATEAMVQKMAQLIQKIISEREMLVVMLALAAALLITYYIRIRRMKYAWMVGAAAGCAAYLVIRVYAGLTLGMELSALQLSAEIAVSLLAAWIAQTMLFSLDYKKTKTVRFEDDEYYYYVKAVPKQKIRKKQRRRRAEGR